MKRTVLLLLAFLTFWVVQVNGQLSITAVDTDFTIDFDNTVADVNEGVFDGTGFAITPTAGQLDAGAWAVMGMSDGDKDFGVENIAGDLARGVSTGGVISGGIYAFEVEAGNYALGVQPGGSDVTPGWVGLKLTNNTGSTINFIDMSYDVWVLNNEDRSNDFNGEYSPDGTNWFPIPELAFTSTELQDAVPAWTKNSFNIFGFIGMDLVDGASLWFRWNTDDNLGGGSRDEFALDNLAYNLSYKNVIATFPFNETFEAASPSLAEWSQIYEVNTSDWTFATGSSGGAINAAQEGTVNARFTSSSGGPNITKLVSPYFDLSSTLTNPELIFYYGQEDWFGDQNELKVYYRTDPANAWIELAYYTSNVATWTEVTMILPDPSENYQIAFEGIDNYGRANVVDNVTIREQPSTTITWCNLQWPDVSTIFSNETVTVYARAYEAGVTDAVGQGANVECWFGYSDTNTDPSTWTDWVMATYSADTDGDSNDEYITDLGPLAEGTYYYASRWRLDGGPYTYGGYNVGGGGFWDGTGNVNGELTVNAAPGTTCAVAIDYGVINDAAILSALAADDNIWYMFTLDQTYADVLISACGSDFDTRLAIYDDCGNFAGGVGSAIGADPAGTIGWDDDACDAGDFGTGDTYASKVSIGTLSAGTYYAVLYGYDATASGNTRFEVTGSDCAAPHTLATENLTATSTDITWIASDLAETAWNIKVNAAVAIDPTMVDGGIVANDAVMTTPLYNLPTLTAETDYYVYVQSDCGSDWVEIMFTTPSACPTPTNLMADLTGTDALLTWDELGMTDWILEVSTTALLDPTAETGDVLNDMAISGVVGEYALNALPTGVTYYWYVMSDCGGSWSAEGQFYVGYCLPEPTSIDGIGITNVAYGQNITVNNPSGDVPTHYEDYSAMIGDAAQGLNLSVDITYETGVTYLTKIWVDWNNDLTFDEITELVYDGESLGDNPTTLNASFLIPIATPLGNYRMRIGGTDFADHDPCYTGTWASYEDYTIEVIAAPACLPPTGLFADNITSDAATLNWTDNGETMWNLVASTAPFDPTVSTGDFGLIPVVTNPEVIVPGTLTPNSTYYWYIQADCGGTTSLWSVEGTFSTECASFAAPFAETFDAYEIECWEEAQGAIADPTVLTGSTSSWSTDIFANAGDNCVRINNYGSFMDEWMITPAIDLGDGSVNYFLTFDIALTAFAGTGNPAPAADDILAVVISTDNGATWSSANTLMQWDNIGSPNVYDALTPAGELATIDLAAYTGEVKFGFYAESTVSNGDNDLFIDNLQVRELSDENDIIDFVLADQTGPALVDAGLHTVIIEVSMGTALTALMPTITISDNAEINPLSGDPQDFTGSDVTPFEYTVTSELGTPQIWEITVNEAITLSSAKDILTFTLPEQTGAATIGANTVDIEVNFMADVAVLTPTITVSDLAIIDPLTDVVQDFTLPVTYTVTAQDLSTKPYDVTVTKEGTPLGAACDNPIAYTNINDPEVIEPISAVSRELWFTVTLDQTYVDVVFSTCASVYDTRLYVYDACGGALLAENDDDVTGFCAVNNNQSLIEMASLDAGTYFVLVSTYDEFEDISDPTTGLLVTGSNCGTPIDVVVANLTATTTDINWTPLTAETAWNIKVNEAVAIDPILEDGDIVVNDAVTPAPTYPLGGLTAETEYFVYIQADCGSDWVEYTFTTPAACPVPTGLNALVLGSNDVTLTWDELGTTDWVIEVSTTTIVDADAETGDVEDNTAVIGAVGTFDLTGLDANTTYYWTVMSDCGSVWAAEGMFTTQCDIIALPWTETFEDDSDSRSCWSQIQEDGTNDWTWSTGSTGGLITTANGGTLNAMFTSTNGGLIVTKLVSPVIDLSIPANYAVEFYYGQEQWFGDQNELKVYYRISDMNPWIEIAHYTEDVDAWTLESIMLPNPSATYQIAFEGIDNWARANVIDDVTIFIAPEIDQIDINTDVANVTVCAGTLEADAIADLASTITVTDTDATEYVVDLTWTIDTYDEATAADYNATGTFMLPAGVAQTDPVTLLEVTAVVTVVDPIDPTFSFPTTVGLGSTPMVLPTTSDNGFTGTWAPTTTTTDVAGDIDYTFTPDAGQCAVLTPIIIPITVSATANPQIATIDTDSDVMDVEVCLNALEGDAIALLASEITITDSDDADHLVMVTWTIDTYDAMTAADYNATGTFVLPFGVDQTDPATDLEVMAVVTVNDLPVVTCPATIPMTADAGVTTLTGATPVGGVYSGTNVTAGDFDPTGLAIGAYVITYTYTDATTGCENSCDFNIDIVTDISTVSVEAIGIYPNPNNGEFTINFNNIEGDVTYQVYDTKGSIIISQDITANGDTEEDVSVDLTPGVYYIKVVTAKQTFVEKLVIE